MSSRPKSRPEPCNNESCGSRRFHQEEDGYTYCDQGHQQSERGAAVVEDTGELVLAGRKHRRVDSDAESTKTGRAFEGSKAVEYYLVALQVVLRRQVKWLVDEGKVSGEIEGIIRELWALRLRKVQLRDGYESGTDTEGQSQMFSSQSEGESGAETNASQGSRRKGTIQTSGIVTLVDTLALCYIATLLLRSPVTVADFISLADKGSLAYYQAIRLVQKSLTEKLPGQYQSLLEPQTILRSEDLQRRVFDTAKQFHEDFGTVMPAVNHPLLLYRWMQALALPIEVFAATTRLARILGLEFGYVFEGTKRSDFPLRYPEVRIMALLVVATKLLFPCDEHDRRPATAQDLAALRMDWEAWQTAQSGTADEAPMTKPLSHSEAFAVTDIDCLNMGDAELDGYLDWYQNNLASENVREQGRAGKEADFRRKMMSMFPTEMATSNSKGAKAPVKDEVSQRLREVQGKLTSLSIVPEISAVGGRSSGCIKRAGMYYMRYREAAELGQTGPIKTLYGKASKLGGTSISGMVKATFAVELRLEKVETRLRKEEVD
ncbi:hypothetical protein LTR95_015850 [Oleoguttula sp. CCFEE 5521]